MKKPNLHLFYYAFLVAFLGSFSASAQIGIGTTDPKSETLLDIKSENGEKGILIPRVSINNISTLEPITSDNGTAAESLLVFNTNTTTGKGFYYWNGTDKWIPLSPEKIWHDQTGPGENAYTLTNVGIGGNAVNSASLCLAENDKGLLINNVALLSTANPHPINSPQEGLLVYNINTNGAGNTAVIPGFYYWNGNFWENMSNQKQIGDVKHSFKNIDHAGWYKLDGRLVSTLSGSAQAAAANLGFTGNLPDATNRVLKGKNSTETMGSQAGNNSITIAPANLPNYNLTGTTNSQGEHTHTGNTNNTGDHSHGFTDFGAVSTSEEIQQTNHSNGNNFSVAQWNSSGVSSTTQASGNHSHSLNINSNGNHQHNVTVNSGGSGTAINTTPASINTNVFIYLGY